MRDLFGVAASAALEEERSKRRTYSTCLKPPGRLTYDCRHCVVIDFDRVECARGGKLGYTKKGDYFLPGILRGKRLSVCQACPEYEDMSQSG